MEDNKNIAKYIIILPIVSFVLLSCIILYIVIDSQNKHLAEDISEIKHAYNITHEVDHNSNEHTNIEDILKNKVLKTKFEYKKSNNALIYLTILTTLIMIIASIMLARKIKNSLSYNNKILQKKVDEQTIELQMIVASKTIENIERRKSFERKQLENIKFTAIGQLAAGITHEINTPLTYIKGNFEMMIHDIKNLPDSKIKDQMIDDSIGITDGVNRLGNIVESMREMSQKSKEIKEDVNIYHTLITSLTLLHNRSKQISSIKLNGLDFKVGMDKNKEYFMSCIQKQRVEQVWVILINNALDELVKIDNFDDRIINVNISCSNDGKYLIIKVKDNAGGINKKILNDIFEPFVGTKESSGIGIGLNIAKNIISEQNGKILAYNEDNGAVFEVVLSCGSCKI
ncbi:MAG TPA: hypothetical protein EYG73_13025 [Arcobacter sp.]|nr:hypothetical protein [Arcobacter sp.]